MDGLTRAEVADLAGVTRSQVDTFVALGLVVPDSHGRLSSSDVRRATILRLLVEAGLPLDAVADAVRSGDFDLDFVDDDAYQRFASFSAETFEHASARTGVPLELLGVVREVTGAPPPRPATGCAPTSCRSSSSSRSSGDTGSGLRRVSGSSEPRATASAAAPSRRQSGGGPR